MIEGERKRKRLEDMTFEDKERLVKSLFKLFAQLDRQDALEAAYFEQFAGYEEGEEQHVFS